MSEVMLSLPNNLVTHMKAVLPVRERSQIFRERNRRKRNALRSTTMKPVSPAFAK